jgi:hypothetical protein
MIVGGTIDRSRVAQWKRAGPITQRSVDRNHALLGSFYHVMKQHGAAPLAKAIMYILVLS